jgi:ribA/ribD-fused uncharacterized protein
MIILTSDHGHSFLVEVHCEETSSFEVKLSIREEELKLNIEVIGLNYHEAIWNLHSKVTGFGFTLICAGVSLNVYPTAMQFDMGLARQGMRLRLGMHTSMEDTIDMLDMLDSSSFIGCNKEDQLAFYMKWVNSKKKVLIKKQEISFKSIEQSNEFLFFWGHQPSQNFLVDKACLSQWWPCSFTNEGKFYNSAEQWMMAEKARLFSDQERLELIMNSNDPKKIKEIGRNIKFFDESVWDHRKYDAVFEGNLLKFKQNEELKSFLISTGNSVLAEASPHDRIWGIGMSQDEAKGRTPLEWKGQNLLGFALMEVRKELVELDS